MKDEVVAFKLLSSLMQRKIAQCEEKGVKGRTIAFEDAVTSIAEDTRVDVKTLRYMLLSMMKERSRRLNTKEWPEISLKVIRYVVIRHSQLGLEHQQLMKELSAAAVECDISKGRLKYLINKIEVHGFFARVPPEHLTSRPHLTM